jgi:hypothetical protein
MTSVRIPPGHREPLAFIARADQGAFEAVLRCWDADDGPVLKRSELLKALDDKVGEVASGLIDALLGARTYGANRGWAPDVNADSVSTSETLDLDQAERDALRARLQQLFESPGLELFARAVSIQAEDQNVYCSARTLSDLRPIFSRGDDPRAEGAIIRHTLTFDVHIDGRIESVAISADEKALTELASAINRALQKGDVLRAIAASSNLRVVDLEETH